MDYRNGVWIVCLFLNCKIWFDVPLSSNTKTIIFTDILFDALHHANQIK